MRSIAARGVIGTGFIAAGVLGLFNNPLSDSVMDFQKNHPEAVLYDDSVRARDDFVNELKNKPDLTRYGAVTDSNIGQSLENDRHTLAAFEKDIESIVQSYPNIENINKDYTILRTRCAVFYAGSILSFFLGNFVAAGAARDYHDRKYLLREGLHYQ